MESEPPSQTQGIRFGLGTEEVRRRHVLPKALLVGLVAGVVASVFRIALQWIERGHLNLIAHFHGVTGLLVSVFVGAAGGGLALWLVLRYSPDSAGSGIPHLKSVLIGERKLDWRRILPVKFLSGLLGIGGGFALGREGPTIQMGGSVGLMVSGWMRVPQGEGERKALISAGAGAGLAAAFNAPLAGMMFVLEELQANLTPVVFVAAFLASVTADVVARLLTSEAPVFELRGMFSPGMSTLPLAAVVGLLAGVGGVIFNRCLIAALDFFDRKSFQRQKNAFVIGAATGGFIGLIGWAVPGIAGTGGSIVDQTLAGRMAVGWAPVLLVVRFGLTMISYGCGTAGGIFIPMFVIGALGGLSVGSVAHLMAPGWIPHPEVFVVLGMGATFTAVVRAPLTGIVLLVELTGIYDFMLPLLVSCLGAYFVADALGEMPIYEALRIRAMKRLKAVAEAGQPPPEATGPAQPATTA
jgi:CIC family chloride channel protein